MIQKRIRLKKRNQLEIEVHRKNIIIKNIVIIHPHRPILLNQVHKKRKNLRIMIHILNIKNTMIEHVNINLCICLYFLFVYDIIKLKTKIIYIFQMITSFVFFSS
jgi:hypothetical protein